MGLGTKPGMGADMGLGRGPGLGRLGVKRNVLGLIPAAGHGKRLGSLPGSKGVPGSKEILPVWQDGQPAVACLLQAMARAGAAPVHVILRPEKQDVVDVLGDGSAWGVDLSYVFTEPTWGPALTLDCAYPQMGEANVLLGFPDILMGCEDPFTPLVQTLETGAWDVALGLFPPSMHQPADPVVLVNPALVKPPGLMNLVNDPKSPAVGAVREILSKNIPHDTPWRWGLAAWTPDMSRFFHEEVARIKTPRPEGGLEWSVGYILNRAIKAGLRVAGVPVSTSPFLDIGTPEGLAWAREGRTGA